MLKYLYLLLLAFTSFTSIAQIKGMIQDSATKQPIPYVNIWVEGENSGTTADENGNFSLPETAASKSIVFSAVGYGKNTISASDVSGTVYLKAQAIALSEVVIESRKNAEEITIGSLKKAQKNSFFGNMGNYPWIYANFFEYKPEYASVPYLKAIRIITDAKHNGSSFNVRLYSAGPKGEPGDFLYDENIISMPKKGIRNHIVDLSGLNIPFPENGFFIALEWLIIESNKYEVIIQSRSDESGNTERLNQKDYEKFFSYTPSFGLTYADEEIATWTYINGKWSKKNKGNSKGGGGLAMELILTN